MVQAGSTVFLLEIPLIAADKGLALRLGKGLLYCFKYSGGVCVLWVGKNDWNPSKRAKPSSGDKTGQKSASPVGQGQAAPWDTHRAAAILLVPIGCICPIPVGCSCCSVGTHRRGAESAGGGRGERGG